MQWLNANTGAVQALATVALLVLTGVYVVLTRRIAVAAQEQTQLIREERAREASNARAILHNAAERLHEELSRLPDRPSGTDAVYNHPGWSDGQLGDFIGYARVVDGVDERRAMQAVSALRRIQRSVDQTKAVARNLGRNYSDDEVTSWQADKRLALQVFSDMMWQSDR